MGLLREREGLEKSLFPPVQEAPAKSPANSAHFKNIASKYLFGCN